MEKKDFITALDDYGFFLQQAGNHQDAVTAFEEVKTIDPNRAVNHLNLGDSLWAPRTR
ncbi:MAG: tetratricopeptide repeat protein [Acidobacteriia bacterium]|nr:tetratricopeptide repeat protein [Terriglobia bacterium]